MSFRPGAERAKPILHRNAREIQFYGKIAKLPIAFGREDVRGQHPELEPDPCRYDDSSRSL